MPTDVWAPAKHGSRIATAPSIQSDRPSDAARQLASRDDRSADARESGCYRGLLFALLLTAGLEVVIAARAATISVDGITFISMADQLSQDPIATIRAADQHPGYPAMILGATRLVQAAGYVEEPQCWIIGARLVSATCGILSVLVVWLFGRGLFDVQIANIAAIALAVLPMLRRNAADAMSDTPHMLFYLLAAWVACEAILRGRALLFVAAGLLSGLAYWVRPEGLEIALVTAVFIFVKCWWTRAGFRQFAVQLTALCLATAAIVTPYLILAGKVTSKQVPFAKQNPPELFAMKQVRAAEANQPAAAAGVMASCKVFFKLLGGALNEFAKGIAQGFRFAFLPFYLLSFVAYFSCQPRWWAVLLVGSFGVLHILVLIGVYFVSGYIDQRHVIPLVALAAPFAGLGLVYAAKKLHQWVPVVGSPRAIAAVLLLVCCLLVLGKTLSPMNAEFRPVLEASQWVTAHARPGEAIVTNSPYVQFFTRMPTVVLTPAAPNLGAVLAQAPGGTCAYAVLHVNAHDYQPSWLEQLERRFDPVVELSDPRPGHDAARVVIFAAKTSAKADHGNLNGAAKAALR